MPGTFELSRLSPGQIDDQAIAEITELLAGDIGYTLQPSTLLRMASTAPLLVARRPCGVSPEIVGVAGLAPRGEGDLLEVVVVNPSLAETSVASELLHGLRGHAFGPSLFRPRDRAPLGWTWIASGG